VSRVRGTPSLWGEGWEQGAVPETPEPFAPGPTLGVILKLSLGCGFCSRGLGPPQQPCLAVFYGVGIVFGANKPQTSTGTPNLTQEPRQHHWRAGPLG